MEPLTRYYTFWTRLALLAFLWGALSLGLQCTTVWLLYRVWRK